MINLMLLIPIFILLWIVSMIIHEVGHVIGAKLTGGDAHIEFWSWYDIPSLHTVVTKECDDDFFKFSGGMFAFFVYMLASFLTVWNPYLFYSFFTIGGIQGFYSIYELLLLGKVKMNTYMKWHYVLYLVLWIIFTYMFYVGGLFS